MNDKTSVPPYEANPSSFPQTAQQAPMHTADSHTPTPGQPMVQHDIYQGQTPISPMQTGTTNQFPNSTNQYPNQPLGSPPLDTYQHQQPTMAQQQPVTQQQPMATPIQHPKGDYYGSQQQVPMQQVQSGQQPMQQQQQQHQTYQTAYALQNLSSTAAPVDCPICRQRGMTRTEYHAGNTTHVWALVLCACSGLGCIPYMITGLKDVEHKCGHCGVTLATWHKSGHVDVHAHA